MDVLSVQQSYVLAKSYDKFTAIADSRGSNLFEKFLPYETFEIGNVDGLLPS